MSMVIDKELYSQVRGFIQYVRITHPSTFNDVLLTVMLIPTRKRRKWEQEQENRKNQPVIEKLLEIFK